MQSTIQLFTFFVYIYILYYIYCYPTILEGYYIFRCGMCLREITCVCVCILQTGLDQHD